MIGFVPLKKTNGSTSAMIGYDGTTKTLNYNKN